MDYLKNKSEKLEEYLNLLRRDIKSLEKDRIVIERTPNDESIITKTNQIKAEINKLKIDCCCLSYQVQMYSGEIPNSLVDPFPDENEVPASNAENYDTLASPLSGNDNNQSDHFDNFLASYVNKFHKELSYYLGHNQSGDCPLNDKSKIQ